MATSTSGPAPDDDGPVLVIGAGVGGLGTALTLSRAGHRVLLIERDATPLPADPDAAFGWDRRGAPQVRHSHALLARLRNLLRDHHPDVLADLLEAGATEMRFLDSLPPEITDRDPRPGDEDLVALACRRTTLEWVLRLHVLADPGVELRDGTVVEGLEVAAPDPTDPSDPTGPTDSTVRPRVVGARLRPVDGDPDQPAEVVAAPLVVAALGRRSAVPRWLSELGVEVPVEEEDTGLIYLSRFYRRPAGQVPDVVERTVAGDLGYLKFAVFQGDNDTHSVTFALDADDAELRAAVLDPEGFDRAAGQIPLVAAWVAADQAEPMTDVHTMGGLINRRIDYLDDDRPRVLGFHAVGEAHTCTNPLSGRGCSLAMVQAHLLADALAAHPGTDAVALDARAVAYEQASRAEVLPWYRAAVNQDRLNRQAAVQRAADRAEDEAAGPEPDPTPAPEPDPSAEPRLEAPEADPAPIAVTEDPRQAEQQENARQARQFMESVMRDGLMVAVRTDATVFRSFLRSFNLLDPPERITNDPEVLNLVLAAYATRDERPPEPPAGPARDELLAALVG